MKLILNCDLSPGDIVMLTAAVRDLHRCYPGRFLTDIRTLCPDLWLHNPHLTPISDGDPDATILECSYPLIDRCNESPNHCLHGFIEFLNERLGLKIIPTAFKGDIHLSALEKSWCSQVREVTREDIPFWIIAAGGKYDLTIKWWNTGRYQAVVNHFRGRIQFVQVGASDHHHPKLNGVIDLRGKTTLRELVRLVYHAQGVLCGVTALMHLAAAIEIKSPRVTNRPCVVVAGGREPAHWEAYPGHQFIHTNGALSCCAGGGCWRDRTLRLRDGDERDAKHSRCVDVVNDLPRCMDLITSSEVIQRIQLYFQRGLRRYLSRSQQKAASRGVKATTKNPFDSQPLNLHSAGLACDRFVRKIPAYPNRFKGRGIVICGGGIRYFTNAWVCINMLRHLKCSLPIQLWHLGPAEVDGRMKALLSPLGVDCVDANDVRKEFPICRLKGWELKPYALLHCSFREVLLLDADNVPVVNPEVLFDTASYLRTGAIFWPDYNRLPAKKAKPVWTSCGLSMPKEHEFESGQIIVNKARTWRALCLTLWFNENSDFYYHQVHGDKETFHLAFRKLRQPYSLVSKPIHPLASTMCQHDFQGRRLFQHRNQDKWDFLLFNQRVRGFFFEARCRGYITKLRRIWDGAIGATIPKIPALRNLEKKNRSLIIDAVMISCNSRERLRRRTLANLAKTDWGEAPVRVQMDRSEASDARERQTRCAHDAIKHSLNRAYDYLLFLEDDLDFNRHLRHSLCNWEPLITRRVTLAGLYNPGLNESAYNATHSFRIVAPEAIFGSQAFLISRSAVHYIVQHWSKVRGMQDIRISRLAGRLGQPILYHAPSLVQHVGGDSTWGGWFHQAKDFRRTWRRMETSKQNQIA